MNLTRAGALEPRAIGMHRRRRPGAVRFSARPGAAAPGLLSYMPATKRASGSGLALKAWQGDRYIPELRLGTNASSVLSALGRSSASPRTVVLNHHDLPRQLLARPEKCGELRKKMRGIGRIILSSVGRDRDLDRYSVGHLDAVARAIGAHAVTTPDEYIYTSDDAHRTFQRRNFLRAKSRAAELVMIPDRPYSVIGLAIGNDKRHMDDYMDFLAQRGIRDWAFPCGDYLKSGPVDVPMIDHFLKRIRAEESWAVLLGISSKEHLLRYRPPAFSNLAPSFDPAHDRSDGSYVLDWPFTRTPAKGFEERCLDTLAYYRALGGRWR